MLMDIQLPGMNGIECIRKMRMISSGLQFLMLTQSVEDENVFDALKAGACGYLLKGDGHEMVIRSIRELRAGGSPMSGHIARKLVNFFNRLPAPESDSEPLTRREKEVLALLAEGRLYKEVSAELGIAMETAKKHVRNIYSKLQVQNRTEALNKWRLFNYDLA
jgi:DNA-binding NarL/FixJ family response regulator